MRKMNSQIGWLTTLDPNEMMNAAKELRAPIALVQEVATTGKLPVVNFAAGGIATPSDAALMMQLGCDGVFVGSGVFKSDEPDVRARAIVEATTFYRDPEKIGKVSRNLGEAMVGINIDELQSIEMMQNRGS
jgi:pyridoxal 5'-phosphate synthase pdxS subunit